MMREPAFWESDGLTARALQPLAGVWTAATRLHRTAMRPWRAPVPVLCVGNVTVGGGGKTPAARALTDRLSSRGWQPHILSRGFGGSHAGPVTVDPGRHTSRDVGDEPLLLARHAPVWVARNRARAAAAAVGAGADILVMDDGLQNVHLARTLSFIVIDGPRGFGNAKVLPAGPLREPLADALSRAGTVVIVGDDHHGLERALSGEGLCVLHARLEAGRIPGDGLPLFAFAGIARPGKFFATLEEHGAEVVKTRSFADHHRYDPMTVTAMFEEANALGARLVTTEKDWVRLDEATRALAEPVPVRMVFRDEGILDALIDRVGIAAS